ncbi:MAG: Tail Collar domain protein [Firmicutes bacterium]|nr:Tail Collar domain protein [Bacillota bacterium]
MSRTVFCPEEVIVVSKGKEDIGKLVELGNDGKFDTNVIPMIGDFQDQVTTEATARNDADKQLQANLEAEANTRSVADKDLQDQISKEIAARTDGDTALQSSLDKEVVDRTDGDSKLQSSINNEVDARTKADQGLQDQLTAEIAARTNAEETESNARFSADQELLNKIDALNIVGNVQYFARQTAPGGWLKADGSAVSRADYANLFDAVGIMFGAGDGSTTFNLPDLRGEFIRGFDNGRGVDTGRILGSSQTEMLKAFSPALGNMLQAAVGETRTTRHRVGTTYDSAYERILHAIGFRTTDEAITTDFKNAMYNERNERKNDEQDAIDTFINNPTAENRKRLQKLKITPKRIENERRRKSLNNKEHAIDSMDKKQKSALKDTIEFVE